MARMSSSFSLILFAVVLFRLSAPALSQECPLPDASFIRTELIELLISVGGEGSDTNITVLDHHFTCLAVASRDRYRVVSVATRYAKNSASGEFVTQFPLECGSGNAYSSSELDQSPPANVFSIETRRDCRTCTTTAIPNTDTAADCVYCSSTCQAVGQGACTSVDGTTCCPFFAADGSCTTNCPLNFAASATTNYTCACNLTCQNGGTPDQPNCTLCNCKPGFTGMNCETNIDDCASNSCLNGTCIDGVNSYSCLCQAGFTGTNCEMNINDCASSPCVHGTCINGVNSYSCLCQAGFTGTNCETDIDDCASSPCVHGTCIDGVNSYSCLCQAGFTGTNCETNIDDCASSPCVNGTCIDGVNTYSCLPALPPTPSLLPPSTSFPGGGGILPWHWAFIVINIILLVILVALIIINFVVVCKKFNRTV